MKMNSIWKPKIILGVVLLFVAGALAGAWTTAKTGHVPFSSTPVLFQISDAAGAAVAKEVSFDNGFASVAKKVLPAVVNISSEKVVHVDQGPAAPFLSDPFFRQFFGDQFSSPVPREQREHSLGSGVIVNPDGYVLTNNHVVEGASDIKVTLGDNRELTAKIVGTDPKADIAVVKLDAKNLPVLTLGDSSKMAVGDFALAVGNPFGLGRTVTMGIISATGRNNVGIEDYEDFIQTDAAINPGNSGGALVNVRGELIGINTAIVSSGGGNQGVGFAVPINMARLEMEQIIKTGKVVRGWLGVEIQGLTPAMAKSFGAKNDQGAVIAQVEPGSPAAKSGLERGDIILALNGTAVTDNRQLSLKVAQMAPGSTARLNVLRNGAQKDISVTLGEQPATAASNAQPSASGGTGGAHLGISVSALTGEIARQLGLPSSATGVVISDVESGSPAEEAGLQRGDVVQEVNRKAVTSPDAFAQAVRNSGNQPVLLLIDRGGNHMYLVVTPRQGERH
jgi:serine protease Do